MPAGRTRQRGNILGRLHERRRVDLDIRVLRLDRGDLALRRCRGLDLTGFSLAAGADGELSGLKLGCRFPHGIALRGRKLPIEVTLHHGGFRHLLGIRSRCSRSRSGHGALALPGRSHARRSVCLLLRRQRDDGLHVGFVSAGDLPEQPRHPWPALRPLPEKRLCSACDAWQLARIAAVYACCPAAASSLGLSGGRDRRHVRLVLERAVPLGYGLFLGLDRACPRLCSQPVLRSDQRPHLLSAYSLRGGSSGFRAAQSSNGSKGCLMLSPQLLFCDTGRATGLCVIL
jgi:hypothetical protein